MKNAWQDMANSFPADSPPGSPGSIGDSLLPPTTEEFEKDLEGGVRVLLVVAAEELVVEAVDSLFEYEEFDEKGEVSEERRLEINEVRTKLVAEFSKVADQLMEALVNGNFRMWSQLLRIESPADAWDKDSFDELQAQLRHVLATGVHAEAVARICKAITSTTHIQILVRESAEVLLGISGEDSPRAIRGSSASGSASGNAGDSPRGPSLQDNRSPRDESGSKTSPRSGSKPASPKRSPIPSPKPASSPKSASPRSRQDNSASGSAGEEQDEVEEEAGEDAASVETLKSKPLAKKPANKRKVLDEATVSLLQERFRFAFSDIGVHSFEKTLKMYDKDHSGSLKAEEFKRLLRVEFKITADKLSDADVKKLLQALDEDGDGEVSAAELLDFVKEGSGTFYKLTAVKEEETPPSTSGGIEFRVPIVKDKRGG